jgi:hypothetical protein
MFSPEGMPIRAVISTDWEEYKPVDILGKILNLLSPDVTHRHTVIAGESLPLITYRTYKDDKYYLDVARTNDLDTIRSLKPGTELDLYPLE